MRYRVTTERTNLKIHAGPHLDSPCIGALAQDSLVEINFEASQGYGGWMKLADRPGWAYSGPAERPLLTLDEPGPPPPQPAPAPPSPKHLLIFFGGWSDGMTPGADLTPGTSADRVYREILSWRLFEEAVAIAKDPEVSNSMYNDAIEPVMQALRDLPDSDRVGSVVIYGFSAGGFNALRLCQRISQEITDTFGLPPGHSRLPRRINLLITIDPCIQDMPGLPEPPNWFQSLDRRAPSIVRHHINYYQAQDPRVQGDDGHDHGCPMPAAEKNVNVAEKRRTITHDAMPETTAPWVKGWITHVTRSNVGAWR